jgi:superfamily II DNA or RNA helicase
VLYDQMIGRGMRGRGFGGTDECLIIDVDDNLAHMDGRRFTGASRQYAEYWTKAE